MSSKRSGATPKDGGEGSWRGHDQYDRGDYRAATVRHRLIAGAHSMAGQQAGGRWTLSAPSDYKLRRRPAGSEVLASNTLPMTSSGRQSPNLSDELRSSGNLGWTESGSIRRRAFATCSGSLARKVMVRSLKSTTRWPCAARPAAIDAVAAPPEKRVGTVRRNPSLRYGVCRRQVGDALYATTGAPKPAIGRAWRRTSRTRAARRKASAMR